MKERERLAQKKTGTNERERESPKGETHHERLQFEPPGFKECRK